MALNYGKLVKLFHETEQAPLIVKEQFQSGGIKLAEIDFGRLFEECYGSSVFRDCRSRRYDSAFASNVIQRHALEGGRGAASTAAFMNISQDFIIRAMDESNGEVETVFTDMIPTMDATTFSGEKLGNVNHFGRTTDGLERPELDPYKRAHPGENYIFSPPIIDRGLIAGVSWEAVFSDRTGQV